MTRGGRARDLFPPFSHLELLQASSDSMPKYGHGFFPYYLSFHYKYSPLLAHLYFPMNYGDAKVIEIYGDYVLCT